MSILIISKYFPIDAKTKVHGVYKRLQMFVDAIKTISKISVLFYVPNKIDVSLASIAKLEHSLSNHWNAEIKLYLCHNFTPKRYEWKWKHYGLGAFSPFQQDGYRDTSGIRQVRMFETCLSKGYDIIFAHRLSAMYPLMLTKKTLPPIFLDLDDIEHIAFFRNIRHLSQWYKRLLNYIILPALCWGEYKAIKLADRTFVCSDEDRGYIEKYFHQKRIFTIPNAVTIPKLPSSPSEQTLLFIGSYSHKPNVIAAEFLIHQIWPYVHKALPAANLLIVGSPPEKIPSYRLNIPGVCFTGFIEDLDSLYHQTRVVCVPILSGSGTRIKILEAAAYGKAIVSTRIGAEGIQMNDSCGIVLHDDPKNFAEACVKLLKDTDLCDRLGSAARATVVKQYDQVKVKQLIQRYFENTETL